MVMMMVKRWVDIVVVVSRWIVCSCVYCSKRVHEDEIRRLQGN